MRVRPPAGRRLSLVLPAAAAAALLAPSAAHADTDLTLVVDSVSEAGYYVDSGAEYFQKDSALDLLRDNKVLHSPVFVAVLPGGAEPNAVLNGLVQGVGRKGTYAVISGQQLRIKSNVLPQAQVKSAYDKAVSANRARPDKALINFVKLLPEAANMPPQQEQGQEPKADKSPDRPPLADTNVGADKVEASERAEAVREKAAEEAAAKNEGGFPMLPVAGGGVVLVLLAGGGFLLWRRRKATPAAGAAGAAGQPGGPGDPGAPGGGPGAPGAPGGSAPGAPGAGPSGSGAGPAAGGGQPQAPGDPQGGQGHGTGGEKPEP